MSSQALGSSLLDAKKSFFSSPAQSGSGTGDQLVTDENASFPPASLLELSQVLSELEPTRMHFFLLGWPTCDYWNCNFSLAFKWSAAWPNTAPACIWWPLTTGSKFEWISIENPKKCFQPSAGNLWYHSDFRGGNFSCKPMSTEQSWEGEMQAVNKGSNMIHKC